MGVGVGTPALDEPVIAGFAEVWSAYAFERGGFALIDEAHISLAFEPLCTPSVWLPLVSSRIRLLFSNPEAGLLANFRARLRLRGALMPRHRVLALPGHYAKVVSRAAVNGMFRWRNIHNESPSVTAEATAITMSSFAVIKDEVADRLISWPRIQNLFFLRPDDVDLPDLSLFGRISIVTEHQAPGCVDISDMFRNIILPEWLSELLPLAPVAFGDQSGDAQRALCSQLQLRTCPKQSTKFRPLQATLPMGFK